MQEQDSSQSYRGKFTGFYDLTSSLRYLLRFCLLFLILLHFPALPQKFTHNNYIEYLPSPGKIISQTSASDSLNLYGDLSLGDHDPLDGIEDDRGYRLQELAAMFSPILYKNNFSAPLPMELLLQDTLAPYLVVDTWELSVPGGLLISSDTIDLALLKKSDEPLTESARSRKSREDDKLKALVEEFHPYNTYDRVTSPESSLRKEIYIDFPGKDEGSWRKAYRQLCQKQKSALHAHAFVREDRQVKSAARFDLILQYWLFYPFNDGGNNHEGDWEHLNVHITTRDVKGGLLTGDDLGRILDRQNQGILDSLVIKKVDYYFHHFVMTLDHQEHDFWEDEAAFSESLAKKREKKFLDTWLDEQIYHRIHLLQDTLNTHPIGYIGADNIGLDQLLSAPGEKNRNSHGTYPFPGIWRSVGPLGATERIRGHKDYQFDLPPVYPSKVPLGMLNLPNPQYKPGKNPRVQTYTADDIFLLPDWERILKLVQEDPAARRKWFWLILPIRWGFPVAESPGAGMLKHVDMGNAAPVGPAYNPGWNRAGTCQGFEDYYPHVLPAQYQTSLQDCFNNNLGFANLLLTAPLSLPVINPAWFYTGARLHNCPKFYPPDELPFRFSSLTYRPYYAFGNDNFARLLPQEEDPFIKSYLQSQPGLRIAEEAYLHEGHRSFIGFMFNLHIGLRLATEHTYSASTSTVRYRFKDANQGYAGQVEGEMKFREFSGSFRVSILTGALQPFAMAGYGWSWYKVSGITLNNSPLPAPETQWYHNPSFPFLPNTWHLGGGVEWFFYRNRDLWRAPLLGKLFVIGKPDLGLRADYMLKIHGLGDDLPNERGRKTVYRHEVGVGVVVGF